MEGLQIISMTTEERTPVLIVVIFIILLAIGLLLIAIALTNSLDEKYEKAIKKAIIGICSILIGIALVSCFGYTVETYKAKATTDNPKIDESKYKIQSINDKDYVITREIYSK